MMRLTPKNRQSSSGICHFKYRGHSWNCWMLLQIAQKDYLQIKILMQFKVRATCSNKLQCKKQAPLK